MVVFRISPRCHEAAGRERRGGNLNYIAEIKAFYDWIEINPLPSPAIALWHALLHIANKTGWKQVFTVSVSVLEIKTGLNAKAIERARNRLAQDGLIRWQRRKGNQSAEYSLFSLCDKNIGINVAEDVLQSVEQPVVEYVAQPVAQSVAINKHKQNKTKQIKENTKKAASELFEKVWALYPVKKGKGQVSDHKKAELLKVGYEEIERCISRYKKGLERDASWRKPQNGSTFFNSGYIDYLDKNYSDEANTSVMPVANPQNRFNNFEQRNYDYDDLERKLLASQEGENKT